MKDSLKYFLAGFFFLLLQGLAIFRNVVSGYNNYFWFCNFVCIPLAVGFFIRKDYVIKGLINIGFIPQLIYVGALVYTFVTSVSLMDTIPENITLFYFFSSLLIHLSTAFALFLTCKKRPGINTFFSSLGFLFGMYMLALFFTTPQQGINYILAEAALVPWTIPYYTELWIVLALLIVVIPTQLVQYFLYLVSNKK